MSEPMSDKQERLSQVFRDCQPEMNDLETLYAYLFNPMARHPYEVQGAYTSLRARVHELEAENERYEKALRMLAVFAMKTNRPARRLLADARAIASEALVPFGMQSTTDSGESEGT